MASSAERSLPSSITVFDSSDNDASFDSTSSTNDAAESAHGHRSSSGVFSCVVDANPRFHSDALRWYATLRNIALVPANDMVVHAVGGTDSDALRFLRSQGVAVEAIRPFDERSPWCNKISGAIHLGERGVEGLAVLTDTDVLVLEDPRRLHIPSHAMGSRLVGAPNPPLRILENMFEAAGLEISGVEPLDWVPQHLTVAGHGNGGLYIVPGQMLSALAHSWGRWATWLMEHVAILENYPTHIDQPSMALALSELGITPQRLDIRWNFPAHNPKRIPANVERPAIIHYHRSTLPEGLVKDTGFAAVDEQIDSANTAIAQVWKEVYPNGSTPARNKRTFRKALTDAVRRPKR
jgi:hypothetical protein